MRFLLLVWKGGVIERFGFLRNALATLGNEAKLLLHPRSSGSVEFAGELVKDKVSLRALRNYKPDYIILWNGDLPEDEIVKTLAARLGIPISYVEMGWFPQEKTVYFDFRGVNASSEIRDIKLKELSSRQRQKLHGFLKKYHKQMNLFKNDLPSDFIFVPLQVETDSNIIKHSPIKKMEGLIKRVNSIFPNETIIVRPHPRQPDVRLGRLPRNIHLDKDSDLHNLVRKAKVVIGANSTVLLEALTYFKPVIALGEGLFSNHNVLIEEASLTDERIRHAVIKMTFKEQKSKIESFLYELIFNYTFYNRDLANPDKVRNTYWYKRISKSED